MPDKFAYVKRGYDPVEVDKRIAELENIIKGYNEKDAAIKNALVNAQVAADNITKNAELEVADSRTRLVAQLEGIYKSVSQQKELMDGFRRDYKRLIERYLKEVDEYNFNTVYEQITGLENYLASLKEPPMFDDL